MTSATTKSRLRFRDEDEEMPPVDDRPSFFGNAGMPTAEEVADGEDGMTAADRHQVQVNDYLQRKIDGHSKGSMALGTMAGIAALAGAHVTRHHWMPHALAFGDAVDRGIHKVRVVLPKAPVIVGRDISAAAKRMRGYATKGVARLVDPLVPFVRGWLGPARPTISGPMNPVRLSSRARFNDFWRQLPKPKPKPEKQARQKPRRPAPPAAQPRPASVPENTPLPDDDDL